MTTVAILPISSPSDAKVHPALAGAQQSIGQTARQALDALTALLGEIGFSGFLVIQNFYPDSLFDAKQQSRLEELMSLWCLARVEGNPQHQYNKPS